MHDLRAPANGHTARVQVKRVRLISWGSSGKDSAARGRDTRGQPGLATPGLAGRDSLVSAQAARVVGALHGVGVQVRVYVAPAVEDSPAVFDELRAGSAVPVLSEGVRALL